MAGSRPKSMFIAFDGLDGAGKTTQVELLREHLTARGLRVAARNLGSTAGFAEALASIKRGEELASGKIRELVYYFEATFAGIEMLEAGDDVVIADRYLLTYCTFGQMHGWTREEVVYFTRHLPPPDLVVLIDISPRVAAERILGSRGKFDVAELGYRDAPPGSELDKFLKFQTRVSELMLEEARQRHAATVDGTQSVASVAAAIASLVDPVVTARSRGV